MKKIINRKKYDTETATLIASYWNGLPGNDFRYLTESLYLKRNGEYFLYGKGGALTKYCISDSNGVYASCDIIPIAKGEADDWVEQHMSTDDFKSHFCEVIE